jgi:hypothetical protein
MGWRGDGEERRKHMYTGKRKRQDKGSRIEGERQEERKMKIWEKGRSCWGREKKINVHVCSYFRDSCILYWDFFINEQLNINIFLFFFLIFSFPTDIFVSVYWWLLRENIQLEKFTAIHQ